MRFWIFTLLLLATTAPVRAMPLLFDMEARLDSVPLVGSRGTLVAMLSGDLFGAGGIAHGKLDLDGAAGPGEPRDVLWLIQNLDGLSPPGEADTISFAFDDTGNFLGIQPTPFFDPNAVAGVQPTPFRAFLAEYPPDPIRPAVLLGELDFRAVSGVTLGSLTGIAGLRLVNRADGGANVEFAAFDVRSVSVAAPASAVLLGTALLVLARPRTRASAPHQGHHRAG